MAAATTMHVPVQVVHSRVTYYQPCLVDLRWSRSIHSCDVCPSFTSVSSTPTTISPLSDTACSAIHYGMCTPVKSAPFKGAVRTAASRMSVGGIEGAPPLPAKKRRINVPITVKVTNKNTTPPIPPVSTATKIAVPITINRIDRVSTAAGAPVSTAARAPVSTAGAPVSTATGAPITTAAGAPVSTAAGAPVSTAAGAPVIAAGAPVTVAKIDSTSDDLFLRQKEAELKLKREREQERERLEAEKNKKNDTVPSKPEDTVKATATPEVPITAVVNKDADVTKAATDTLPSVKPIQPCVEDTNKVVPPAHIPTEPSLPATTTDIPVPATPDKIPEDVIIPPVISNVTPAVIDMEITSKDSEIISKSDEIKTEDRVPSVTDTTTVLPTDTDVTTEIIKDEVIVTEPEPVPSVIEPEPEPEPPSLPEPSISQEVLECKSSVLPRFYLPLGRPSDVKSVDEEVVMSKVKTLFSAAENGQLNKTNIKQLTKACGLPLYWKQPFYFYLGGDTAGHVTLSNFTTAWKKLLSECHDEYARFVRITSRSGQDFLIYDDLLPLIQDVVDTHPGLTFLLSAPEFHSRYVQTVIARIFYYVTCSWAERISLTELRKSKFLQVIRMLEKEDDINRITHFFSYEHFYVIYCKFWELDKDHDLMINRDDLARHNDHAISARMVDRIFSGAVTKKLVDGKMTYRDFVWFLISEEDKRHPRSIEYWFRCMDLDGDGVISMYEMEYFYEEQLRKMEMLGVEILPYPDCVSQMFDMIRPMEEGKIHLMDLKRCELPGIFYDTFFNLEKYLEQEQKDPFARLHEDEEGVISDWERYAAIEYDRLVAEEGGGSTDQAPEIIEDEPEQDDLASESIKRPSPEGGEDS